MAASRELTLGAMSAAVIAGLIAAAIWATGANWWPFGDDETPALVGGCAPFNLYAQNQFEPYATNTRLDPHPSAEVVGGFSPNELVTVDGWVRTRTQYPTNSSPWHSDAWFHLANDQGWASFAAVRSVPTSLTQTAASDLDLIRRMGTVAEVFAARRHGTSFAT